MRRRLRPHSNVVRHFLRPGVREVTQSRARRSERGPAGRWASADQPMASGDGVALSNGSATRCREDVSCSFASSSATKHGGIASSGAAYKRSSSSAATATAAGSSGAKLGAVTASFADTLRRRRYLTDLSTPPTRGDSLAGGLSRAPRPCHVEGTRGSAMTARKVVAREAIQGVVARAVFAAR